MIPSDAWDWVLGGAVSIVGFFTARHIRRVDRLEERFLTLPSTVDIDELKKGHRELRQESTSNRSKVYTLLDKNRLEQKEDLRLAIAELKDFINAKVK